jgi:membrane protein implicated in regulation of membrane protease activity
VPADHQLIGKVCRVTGRIEPGRLGEVMVPIRGGSEAYYASADDAIEAGERVVIVDSTGNRTVIVSRLT